MGLLSIPSCYHRAAVRAFEHDDFHIPLDVDTLGNEHVFTSVTYFHPLPRGYE